MDFIWARQEHLDAIERIVNEAKAQLAGLGLDQWQQGYPNRETFAEDIDLGRARVAIEDGQVIGACAFVGGVEPSYVHIEGEWLTGDAGRYASVHRFCVSDAAKGRGVAGRMFADALVLAHKEGLDSVRVDTHPGNLPMQRALQKAGFAKCGVIHLVTRDAENGNVRWAYEKRA